MPEIIVPEKVKVEDTTRLATALGVQNPDTSKLNEIYQFFLENNPKNPYEAFIEYFSKLPTPRLREKKIDQVLKSIKLARLSNKLKKQLNEGDNL